MRSYPSGARSVEDVSASGDLATRSEAAAAIAI
jgi:hypothetical protein